LCQLLVLLGAGWHQVLLYGRLLLLLLSMMYQHQHYRQSHRLLQRYWQPPAADQASKHVQAAAAPVPAGYDC
jgi:hypothetical protein